MRHSIRLSQPQITEHNVVAYTHNVDNSLNQLNHSINPSTAPPVYCFGRPEAHGSAQPTPSGNSRNQSEIKIVYKEKIIRLSHGYKTHTAPTRQPRCIIRFRLQLLFDQTYILYQFFRVESCSIRIPLRQVSHHNLWFVLLLCCSTQRTKHIN